MIKIYASYSPNEKMRIDLETGTGTLTPWLLHRSKNWNSINLEKFGGLWLRWGESHLISSLGGLIKTFEIQWCIFPKSFKLDKMLGLRSPEDIYDDTFFVTPLHISKYTPSSVFQMRRVKSYLGKEGVSSSFFLRWYLFSFSMMHFMMIFNLLLNRAYTIINSFGASLWLKWEKLEWEIATSWKCCVNLSNRLLGGKLLNI